MDCSIKAKITVKLIRLIAIELFRAEKAVRKIIV
jgi:hypothetical protein